MCTAIAYKSTHHYFGRNLDLEYHYNETVTITPRNFPFSFRCERPMNRHYATIGMALVEKGYPLYYDATNEHGLSMAGLNFPGNAVYHDPKQGAYNVTAFEFIPWILGQCKTISDVNSLLCNTNIVNIPFSEEYPLSDLHWMISDNNESITVESVADGLKVYKNPVEVLTNNPPFDYHIHNLSNYLNLTALEPQNRIAPDLEIPAYSRGMGAIGLPGDLSSASRFVRAAFTKLNSVCEDSASAEISQFFHILGSVFQQAGCVQVGNAYEKTVYTSCCDTDNGIYYYTTYENSQITGINMHNSDLDSTNVSTYPLLRTQQIRMEN